MRVRVYFNLHKKMFSVVALTGHFRNKVIFHANKIMLKDAKFRVQLAGRKKVLSEKKKNVHAFVYGYISKENITNDKLVSVTYNPYKYASFVLKDSKLPIYKSNFVIMNVENNVPFMFVEC